MTAISARMKASMVRMPKLWNHSSSSVSSGGQHHARQQRNVEQQVERDGRAQHFGQVAGAMAISHRIHSATIDRARIRFAAGLRQIAAGDDAEARAQRLQQNGHGVRHDQHPQQPVAEARAAFEVGGPVAGVHVADADQVSRAGEGEHAPPEICQEKTIYARAKTGAILSCCLALLASGMAYGQAPAGPNRPAGVPEGYVITPFGYFHPSCVRQLGNGDTVLGGRVIQHADGTLETLAVCEQPRYTASGELVITGPEGSEPPTIGHSWIESASTTTSTSYGELVATWTVPPAPTSNNGQTVYLFPGMEDINDVVSIIQPVLGWNSDFGSAWGIASWNCCPSGITVESTPVRGERGRRNQRHDAGPLQRGNALLCEVEGN
jgi:hypothetical protein